MKRLKVFHAITMLELGGAQRNTLDTVAGLDRNRFDVALACAHGGELLAEARTIPATSLFLLPHLRREVHPLRDALAFVELWRAIRRFGADIVHTHSSKAGVLGRAAARAAGVGIIVHSIHGFGFGPHQVAPVRWAFAAAERLAARWTTAFIAVSRENAKQGLRMGLFGEERVHIVRSGIDLAAFRQASGGEALRAALGIPRHAPLIVQVSCFKPQKAPERFVEVARRVGERMADAHFLLVGDGELRDRLERLRADAGLEARLHLPGWRRDVPAILAAATVVTLTSRFEGLPRVLVEALAARVPVVAMAVDGVVEVVQHDVNGFLVPEGDVAAMAARVIELVENPALRQRLAAAAGDHLDEFDRDRMVREQERLYAELACQRGWC